MSKHRYKNISNIWRDQEGRILVCDLLECESRISIVALYAPNADCPKFFRDIENIIKNRNEHKILIGDFNLAIDMDLDRENTYNNNNKALEVVMELMEQFQLRDSWRVQNGDKREFSWKKKGAYPTKASRIDFALVSGGLDQMVKLSMYITSIKTDHRAFYMTIDIEPFERGVGYWKFNTSLLRNVEFVKIMENEIRMSLDSTRDKDSKLKWEILKKRIKSATSRFSKESKRQENIVIAQLSEKVNEYESRLPLTREEDNLLEETKTELEEKTMEKVRGIMFRSKVRWYEEGEKNTKYFYALEKAKYNAKTCYKMISEEGEEIQDPVKILKEQRKFYQELYDVEEDVNFTLTNTYGLYVPQEIVKNQDLQLSIEDLQEAIKGMNNDKTPGVDGIPVDFYKVFWKDIKECFYQMVMDSHESGSLHNTARQGILNLIPKAQKDSRYVKNLRPITLLNTDYKIIEKAIANKMIPALKHIIHSDQRGFMKERRISVNIRKMLDIIHLAEKEDLEAVVLSLDFVKCFDKCSFTILHGSLEFFGFGEKVKEWTKILYEDFTVKIQNNGHFSESLPIKKGVHQGGCCSSIYFLVIAEILALALRANDEIEGITYRDIRNLLNQFADDMDIFFHGN